MIMEVWKIIFLSKWVICRFHLNLPGCSGTSYPPFSRQQRSNIPSAHLRLVSAIAGATRLSTLSKLAPWLAPTLAFTASSLPGYPASPISMDKLCWLKGGSTDYFSPPNEGNIYTWYVSGIHCQAGVMMYYPKNPLQETEKSVDHNQHVQCKLTPEN